MPTQPRANFDAAGRLTHLEAIASAKHHELMQITERRRSAFDDRARLRARIAELEASNVRGGSDHEITRLSARLADVEDAIQRLGERESAASEIWNTAGRTFTRALERARELGLQIPAELAGVQ